MKIPVIITLGVIVGLSLLSLDKAYGLESDKDTIVFLTTPVCDQYERLYNELPEYHVYCTNEPNVMWARMHFSGFEQYFHVIYVQESYYQLTPTYKVAGIAFNGAEEGHAISIDANFAIEHERQHLVCKCHNTPDHYHN